MSAVEKLVSYIEKHGGVRDLEAAAKAAGFGTVNSVRATLNTLRRRGRIAYEPGNYSAIRVVGGLEAKANALLSTRPRPVAKPSAAPTVAIAALGEIEGNQDDLVVVRRGLFVALGHDLGALMVRVGELARAPTVAETVGKALGTSFTPPAPVAQAAPAPAVEMPAPPRAARAGRARRTKPTAPPASDAEEDPAPVMSLERIAGKARPIDWASTLDPLEDLPPHTKQVLEELADEEPSDELLALDDFEEVDETSPTAPEEASIVVAKGDTDDAPAIAAEVVHEAFIVVDRKKKRLRGFQFIEDACESQHKDLPRGHGVVRVSDQKWMSRMMPSGWGQPKADEEENDDG